MKISKISAVFFSPTGTTGAVVKAIAGGGAQLLWKSWI
jgi:hypothetical protein